MGPCISAKCKPRRTPASESIEYGNAYVKDGKSQTENVDLRRLCVGLPTDYSCELSHSYIGNGRAWAFPFMGSLPSIWEVWPYMGSPPIHETAFYMWAVFPHIGSIPMYDKPSCVWETIPYMGRLPILGIHVVMVAYGADVF